MNRRGNKKRYKFGSSLADLIGLNGISRERKMIAMLFNRTKRNENGTTMS